MPPPDISKIQKKLGFIDLFPSNGVIRKIAFVGKKVILTTTNAFSKEKVNKSLVSFEEGLRKTVEYFRGKYKS